MPKGIYERALADDRFDANVDRSGDCHLWTGPLASTGYANFWFEGRYVGAHVYAWAREHGWPAKGEVIRHRCRNRHCVNGAHLECGSKGDNNRDRRRDGTQHSVLTADQVRRARELHAIGVPVARIARDLGVNEDTLRKAVEGRRSWAWLR